MKRNKENIISYSHTKKIKNKRAMINITLSVILFGFVILMTYSFQL